MNLLRHIQIQLKIMIRYTDLVIGSIMLYVGAGLVVLSFKKVYPINIPLLCIAFSVFSSGALFGRIFCETKNEIMGYMLTPWSLRAVILSKNVALFVLSAVMPLPLLVSASFFVPITAQDVIDMALYFITSLSVCLLLGNMFSVSKDVLSTDRYTFTLLQWIIVFASPIPYSIFKSWMQSWSLCVSFFFVSCFVWYFYEVPRVEKKFQTVFYKIS